MNKKIRTKLIDYLDVKNDIICPNKLILELFRTLLVL